MSNDYISKEAQDIFLHHGHNSHNMHTAETPHRHETRRHDTHDARQLLFLEHK